MGLSKSGYEYIEESCLTQLDDFLSIENFMLESYTVLVPKSRATTPAYYGTYQGFTFYSADYSEYKGHVISDVKTSYSSEQEALDFAKGLLDWVFTFVTNEVASFSYSMLCNLYNDKNFEVFENDGLLYDYHLNPATCRGIYTKSGPNGGYVRYYSSERASVTPSITYFATTADTRTQNFARITVAMPNYYDSTYQMQRAYDWIMGTGTEYPERYYLADEVGRVFCR